MRIFLICLAFSVLYLGAIALICLLNCIGSGLPKSTKADIIKEVKPFKAHEMNGQTS